MNEKIVIKVLNKVLLSSILKTVMKEQPKPNKNYQQHLARVNLALNPVAPILSYFTKNSFLVFLRGENNTSHFSWTFLT